MGFTGMQVQILFIQQNIPDVLPSFDRTFFSTDETLSRTLARYVKLSIAKIGGLEILRMLVVISGGWHSSVSFPIIGLGTA